MEEKKKRKNQGEKGDSHALNYEDMLNNFALEEGKEHKTVGDSRADLDGLALAELLGGGAGDSAPVGAASGHFDSIGASDYSELARQFEELDLSSLTDESPEEGIASAEAEDMAAPLTGLAEELELDESLSPEDAAGYAALLDQLESEVKPEAAPLPDAAVADASTAEEKAPGLPDWELRFEPEPADTPARNEVLAMVNLAEDREPPAVEPAAVENTEPVPAWSAEAVRLDEAVPDEAVTMQADALPAEPVETEPEGLDLSDLFTGNEGAAGVRDGEPAILPEKAPEAPTVAAVPEMDFLGLTTAVSPQENRAAGKPARRMETLFEGVEMDFEDQTAEVTLAELLLAQGKKKEAADLFRTLSKNKGVTFWVAKRLRVLAASVDK